LLPHWILGLSLVALLVSLAAALYIAQSGPIAAARVLRDLSQRVETVEATVESVSTRWRTYREEVEALLEQMEDSAERAERIRRRTAQAAARLKRKEGNGSDGESLEVTGDEDQLTLRRKARARGFQV